eukprot:9148673-Karenia_brevis.AAC.1
MPQPFDFATSIPPISFCTHFILQLHLSAAAVTLTVSASQCSGSDPDSVAAAVTQTAAVTLPAVTMFEAAAVTLPARLKQEQHAVNTLAIDAKVLKWLEDKAHLLWAKSVPARDVMQNDMALIFQ